MPSGFALNDNSVEIYQPDDYGNKGTCVWRYLNTWGYISRAYVIGDRLVFGGGMAAAKRVKKGLAFEVWKSDGSDLTPDPFYGPRDDSEIWTFNVGFGTK